MMKVVLVRDTRIAYKTGETIEVSPELFDLLVSTGSAEPVPEKKESAKKTVTKKK